MAKRCPMCRAPMKEEIVFHRKITLDNKPQLYHYVRRYTCPEGCTAVLDFTKAKPLVPGAPPHGARAGRKARKRTRLQR